MKKSIAKYFVLFVLLAAVLNLTGCASVFLSTFNLQQVTIVADDDDAYDFYVNGKLKCENTNVCEFYHSTYSRCQLTIEAKRGDVVLGTERYGYWEEPPLLLQILVDDDTDKSKCPEDLFGGAQAVVEIDQDVKKRVKAANQKRWVEKPDIQWKTSTLQ